jgi:hypothetical protein
MQYSVIRSRFGSRLRPVPVTNSSCTIGTQSGWPVSVRGKGNDAGGLDGGTCEEVDTDSLVEGAGLVVGASVVVDTEVVVGAVVGGVVGTVEVTVNGGAVVESEASSSPLHAPTSTATAMRRMGRCFMG